MPEETHPNIVLEHLARYRFAKTKVSESLREGKAVILDVGCGGGYGLEIITSDIGLELIGGDNSVEALKYAGASHRRPNFNFVLMDAQSLPFADRVFDLVISYEVIEHVNHPTKHLSEANRVLKFRIDAHLNS